MNATRVLIVGIVALIASVAVACGDDGGPPAGGEASGGGGVGMIAPNTFMTFDGRRYELVNMLLEKMVATHEFSEIGVLTGADIDLADTRVFERAGDTTAVYTYSPATADDDGIWLAWRAAS